MEEDSERAPPLVKVTTPDVDHLDYPNYPNTKLGQLKYQLRQIMEHIWFRVATIFLILADVIIVIVNISLGPETDFYHELELISQFIISYFVVEIFLRIFYEGHTFFQHWTNILDMIVVFETFFIDIFFAGYAKLGVIGRVFRIIRIIRRTCIICSGYEHVKRAKKRRTSKAKYEQDGLGFCYITERFIAISFQTSVEKIRNFLEEKHSDHYRVYVVSNTTDLKHYNETFQNSLLPVYIEDYSVSELKAMSAFCNDVTEWLGRDEENVVVLLCDEEKGNIMFCTYLILTVLSSESEGTTAEKVLAAVETPSQMRYLEYNEILKSQWNADLPLVKHMRIESIKITSIKGVGNGDGTDLSLQICKGYYGQRTQYDFKQQNDCKTEHNKDEDYLLITFPYSPIVSEDVRIRFISKSKNIPKMYDSCAFYFWFHTAFIKDNRLVLSRDEIDNTHRTKAQSIYRETFSIDVVLRDVK